MFRVRILFSVVLIPVLALMNIPFQAFARDHALEHERLTAIPAPPAVTVNRTPPMVEPPPAFPLFSVEPTDAEIRVSLQ